MFGTDTPTWQSVRGLLPDSDYVNSDDQIKFMLVPHALNATGNYRVYLRLYAKDFDEPLVFQSFEDISVVAAPSGGSLEIDSAMGSALSKEFQLSAPNWSGYSTSLRFQFFFEEPRTMQLVALSPSQAHPFLSTILPSTSKLYVKVSDLIGGSTLFSLLVRISNPPLTFAEVEASVNKIGYGLSNLVDLSLWAQSLGQLPLL